MAKKGWAIPESQATPEKVFLNRRKFIQAAGVSTIGVAGLLTGCKPEQPALASPPTRPTPIQIPKTPTSSLYPFKRNETFTLDRPLTDERVAATFNNFYEFDSRNKNQVWRLIDKFTIRPWTVEVTGLVHKPQTFDIDLLIRTMPLEERLYRHRCVETWAMAVPWTGFPLKALLNRAGPKSSAKFVRFVSFFKPDQAPEQKNNTYYPWPYYEGLSLAEAMNDLTLLATGIYGHELLKQHGAPIRLVVPWKYGFKSIKSIVQIELTDQQPGTLWHDLVPHEYGFTANVNPEVPHPRWSQSHEWMIPDRKDRRPTLPYNSYGEYVADLYA